MDRNKQATKGGKRGMPPGEMIALGSRRRPEGDGVRSSTPPVSSSERKREAPERLQSSSSLSIPKKPKLGSPTPLGKPSVDFPKSSKGGSSSSSSFGSRPSSKSFDVPSRDLVEKVLEADAKEDDKRIEYLLCGALGALKNSRAKPDPALFIGLMFLAKTKPMLFETETVVESVCGLLRRDVGISFKSKGNPLVPILACNILMHAFLYEDNWPEIFVKVYIEDAVAERVWVDQPKNQEFVNNIITAFSTKPTPKHLSVMLDPTKAATTPAEGGGGSPSRSEDMEVDLAIDLGPEDNTESPTDNATNRFTLIKERVESYIINNLKEQLTRRQGMDIPRNLLRMLATACGLIEVRLMVAPKLEMWLHNPKLTRPAQELLLSLCVNCSTHSTKDVEVMGMLIKMRVKTKPLFNHYLLSIRELLSQHPENLATFLKHTVYNELSATKNPHNMAIFSAIFQHSPERAAKVLASAFLSLLIQKDDYVKAVRALFREIVKTLQYDIDFSTFCLSMMQERKDGAFTELESAIKDRYLKSSADIICLTSFLSVTPQLREAVNAYTRGDRKDVQVIRKFQQQSSLIQKDSVWWMHTIVPEMYPSVQKDFPELLQKLLFMKPIEAYCSKDNWPPEKDRSLLMSLLSEVPVEEDTLVRILIMGLTKEISVNAGDAIDLVDKMVKRAAVLHTDDSDDFSVLKIERLQLIDALLNCCTYHHPENISLPEGYKPPALAIINLYWKSWVILLILAAFNPQNIGKTGWEQYPTLRCMMEMVMTNNFKFPPSSLVPNEAAGEDFKANERQMTQLEKEEIIAFENHLASVTITEKNSLLIAQLIHLNPRGLARRPPLQVLEQLQQLNKVLKLGHMFCKSRDPDFLLDVIHQQGTTQSMSWLSELVNSSDTSLDMLPVQCLCEFLMNAHVKGQEEASTSSELLSEEKQKEKEMQLSNRIQVILSNPEGKPETTYEILEYFMKKLVLVQTSLRSRSLQVLDMVISRPSEEDYTMAAKGPNAPPHLLKSQSWLLRDIQKLPHFDAVKTLVSDSLRKAMQVETDPATVSAYLAYLAHHVNPSELSDVVQDLAQLIVERLTLLTFLLPKNGESSALTDCNLSNMLHIFCGYLQRATSSQGEGYSWSDTQDQVFLQWESGMSATMHIFVVHAMVILLTYGPPKDPTNFKVLLSAWFPDQGPPPKAFLVDTSEEALLFPDWLKLRMIRSSVPRLVENALQELEPAQLVLFVQSFGIPVKNVSKLLAHLDAAADQMPAALSQAVASKAYMARLVEVQQLRGSTGGGRFKRLLSTADEPKQASEIGEASSASKPDVVDVEMREEKPVVSAPARGETWSPSDCYNQLRKLLIESTTGHSERQKILRQLQKMLMQEHIKRHGKSSAGSESIFHSVLDALRGFVQHDDDRGSMIMTINANSSLISALFRVILQQGLRSPPNVKRVLVQVITTLQNTHCIRDNSLNKLMDHYREKLDHVTGDTNRKEGPDKRSEASRTSKSSSVNIHQLLTNPESLFLKSHDTKGGSIYPLTLLAHQTDWQVLQRCIENLLGENIDRYNPSTVLDFLWACLHNPKLWQGRDIRATKRHGEEDILSLTPDQSCKIAAYIVMEALSATTVTEKSALSVIQQRLILLVRCCTDDRDTLMKVGEYLNQQINSDSPSSKWYRMLLTELYLQIPEIVIYLANVTPQNMTAESSNLPSGIDSFSHRLLTLLASPVSSKAGEQRKSDALAALRTLASSHPALLMRQIPMIGVLLQGRTHLNMREFRGQGHQQFFSYTVTILHLLKPHLFQANPEDLDAIFKSYFDVIHRYSATKPTMDFIVTKFIEILCQYYQANSSQAKAVLHNYMNALNFISQARSDLPALKSLLASLSLSEETTDSHHEGAPGVPSPLGGLPFREEIPGVGGGREETASPIPGIMQSDVKPMMPDEIASFQERLHKGNDSEGITDALNELDSRCTGKTEYLLHFTTQISNLMTCPEEECRVRAFSLAIRLCKQLPSTSSSFLASFLAVLQSDDGTIVQTALNNLPDFCLLSQGHAPLLLRKAFSRGLEDNLDTSPAISETMQLLNMEAASVSAV